MTRILDGIGPGAVGQTGTSRSTLEPGITGPTNSLVSNCDRIRGILKIACRAGSNWTTIAEVKQWTSEKHKDSKDSNLDIDRSQGCTQ